MPTHPCPPACASAWRSAAPRQSASSHASARCPSARLALAALGWAAASLIACAGLGALGGSARAQNQPNFKPLERGDFTEAEQKMIVIRGIEVGGDYALRLRTDKSKDMQDLDSGTTMDQDFRLRLGTVFNDDVAMKLTLQTSTTSLDSSNLRTQPVDNRGRELDGQNLTLTAREVYLQYRFNPNSALNLGKFELELGDMRGKVYRGIASGLGFDCRVGTWCMPFGATKVGPQAADWLYHWALKFRAYDEYNEGMRRAFEVAIFRMIYTENNIPLGNGLGPAFFNPANPTGNTGVGTLNRTQLTDDVNNLPCPGGVPICGHPIYYDATAYNYFGLRINWEATSFFSSFDFTNAQGSRSYHLYRDPTTGVIAGPTNPNGAQGALFNEQGIQGVATEVELGWRWAPAKRGRLGTRYMSATGDTNGSTIDGNGNYRSPNGNAYNRGLSGYYEITPGTYQGTRLYFNGADSQVDLGGGLGHSVNNKQLWGFFIDYEDPEGSKVGYSGGLYKLDLNNSVLTTAGRQVKDVGVEWDNMLTWFPHKKLAVQFEVNLLSSGGAMSIDDNTPPPDIPQLFVQMLMRVVYRF